MSQLNVIPFCKGRGSLSEMAAYLGDARENIAVAQELLLDLTQQVGRPFDGEEIQAMERYIKVMGILMDEADGLALSFTRLSKTA